MARMQGLTIPSGNRSLLIIAALAGLAAAVLFVVAVNNGDNKSPTSRTLDTGNTVVAINNISRGQEIKSEMVELKSVSNDLLVANALADPAKVIGQYAMNDIAAHDQITAARINTSPPGDCVLACELDHGTVATSLQVKEVTAVGGNLYAGNRVDVIGAFKIKNDGSVKDCSSTNILRTQTILYNVPVLRVAQEPQKSAGTPGDPKAQPGAATITLALKPEQSLALISAQERAKTVWTSLRSNAETDVSEVPPLNECFFD